MEEIEKKFAEGIVRLMVAKRQEQKIVQGVEPGDTDADFKDIHQKIIKAMEDDLARVADEMVAGNKNTSRSGRVRISSAKKRNEEVRDTG